MRLSPPLQDDACDDHFAGTRSPVRTVQVLQCLAAHRGGTSLAVVSQELQLPKTSLFRILHSLENAAYVVSHKGVYQVGPEALKLGMALMVNRDMPYSARPTMEWLARESLETIILAELDERGTQVVYKDVLAAANPLRFSVDSGTTKPLYTSASGLVILAYLPGPQLGEYLRDVVLEPHTPQTITTVGELEKRLERIRATGLAESDGGMFEGVYSVAAPLVNDQGRVGAAISISAPSVRALKQRENFARLILKGASEVSRLLGYRGVYPPAYRKDQPDPQTIRSANSKAG